ncbi:MAG: DUF2997 domain-containing protein [Geitlerinemataceae cyanobacterium]
METLEFVIYPDGRVIEKVTGIEGASCADLTAALEAELGVVLSSDKTSEFFAASQAKTSQSAHNSSLQSDWS